MFGRKTKRIAFLEERCKSLLEQADKSWLDNQKLQNENSNLRLHNGRLMNEVGKLQTQVQRLGLERGKNGQFKSVK